MTDMHRDAVEEFLRIFDERSAPIVDRRKSAPPAEIVTARRSKGPVATDLAYWVSPRNDERH